MSVIAWDGKMIASDSAGAAGNYLNRIVKVAALDLNREVPLIGRLSTVLFGVVGQPENLIRVGQFLAGEVDELDLGADEDCLSLALIASREGVWLWQGKGSVAILNNSQCAIGDGAPAALGAMAMGATAVQAVEAACMVVDSCRPPVQAFAMTDGQPLQTQEPPEFHEQQEEPHDQQGSAGAGDGQARQPRQRDRRTRQGKGAAARKGKRG